MEHFFSSEEAHEHLEKNWLEEMYSRDVYLIRRYKYSPIRFEFLIEFFNPEKAEITCTFLFSKVTSFIDVMYESEVFDESYDYDETEDPMDFFESRKDGVTEFFLYTNLREIQWRTSEIPQIQESI